MIESSCHVHINWEHFRHNIRMLKGKGHTLMPVIKADAYGHGIIQAAAELESMHIEWAAAGTPQEAALVRNAGFSGHIVALLSHVPSMEDVRLACEKKITLLIHNQEGLQALKNAAGNLCPTQPLTIAIKQNTGMGRLGFTLDDMEELAEELCSSSAIIPIVQISHFAVADDPDEQPYTEGQCSLFYQAASILQKKFPSMRCSLGNTAGLIEGLTDKNDICRPGIALYGYDPLYGTAHEGKCGSLLPVMEVSAPLISVHPLRKGESVGYGRTYTAESDRLIGWVAIGYADGYRRNPANGTCMCVNGIRVPVIGRVAMQMTCIDLTNLPFRPSPGDEVFILGGPGHAVSAQELANWWETIPYEVTCLLGKNRQD